MSALGNINGNKTFVIRSEIVYKRRVINHDVVCDWPMRPVVGVKMDFFAYRLPKVLAAYGRTLATAFLSVTSNFQVELHLHPSQPHRKPQPPSPTPS